MMTAVTSDCDDDHDDDRVGDGGGDGGANGGDNGGGWWWWCADPHCLLTDILVTTPNRLVHLLNEEPPGVELHKWVPAH